MEIRLPSWAEVALATLDDAGYEAYAVGGCVRDALLGRPLHDIDITTSATPEQVKAMVERRKMRVEKQTRPVVRVDDKTGEVVRFHSVTAASDSIGRTSISMNLLTNRPLKGYRFYYEEDWKDGDGNG